MVIEQGSLNIESNIDYYRIFYIKDITNSNVSLFSLNIGIDIRTIDLEKQRFFNFEEFIEYYNKCDSTQNEISNIDMIKINNHIDNFFNTEISKYDGFEIILPFAENDYITQDVIDSIYNKVKNYIDEL